ncbi:MAG: TlyA family RNA methyltransferase [Oscillospiraceae bacterium]|nr:TlyA family RNA methyltransferase [Oscillospiraceae bacterium]
MKKERLDVLVVERGLCASRERAKAEIMSGNVFVNGIRADKPGMTYAQDAPIELRGAAIGFVSRGGLKLEKALREFGVSPKGRICVDCGASTGGFTDCLLKGGAEKVYAVDVGYGQLAWSLRNDPRVVNMERTNIRYIKPEDIPDKISLAVIDVSFISLSLVLPPVKALLEKGGEIICLIKPQFEAGKDKVGKKGVVRRPEVHTEVLDRFLDSADKLGLAVRGLTWSPVRGPEGNIEYLGHLVEGGTAGTFDTAETVKASHTELE